ncbi:hypothetical protein V500_10399 [Pseudogymnoascus sp. VKM F-4518 (FW-2643)]|nr:hypothetical protein V500_10399 [Pseudogymnoascus sp. VKM F-4518 (FW-2643)]
MPERERRGSIKVEGSWTAILWSYLTATIQLPNAGKEARYASPSYRPHIAYCFQENPKGALQHLWAAIQFLPESEDILSASNSRNMVPLRDAMLELDILAQKLVPYASSSFSRFSKLTIREADFGSGLSTQHPGNLQQNLVVAERHRLIQLVCGHNKSSRVIWGSWYPTSDRPSRDKLIDFLVEIQQWRENSPATFACSDMVQLFDSIPLDMRPLPPIACRFSTNEMALNMLMYNTFVGCSLAMIATTDVDPAPRELESMGLVYQSLCITAGLVESRNDQSENRDKPCDAIRMGISVYIYQIARRCFSQVWQQWMVATLRLIGPEGLTNGFTSANTLEIMFQLEANIRLYTTEQRTILWAVYGIDLSHYYCLLEMTVNNLRFTFDTETKKSILVSGPSRLLQRLLGSRTYLAKWNP